MTKQEIDNLCSTQGTEYVYDNTPKQQEEVTESYVSSSPDFIPNQNNNNYRNNRRNRNKKK